MENIISVKPSFVTKKVAKSCSHSNEKGGVGKTTVAFNQAFKLADEGHRVVVVDFDGQRNMSKLLLGSIKKVEWIENNGFTSAELFKSDLKQDDIVMYQSPAHENLYVIPAHKERIANVLAAGRDAKDLVGNPKKYLDKLDVDYIFIDTPPSLGLTQLAAINFVDYIFVPITVDDFSNEGLLSLLKTIKAIKDNLRSNVQIGGIYINLFKKPTTRRGENPYADVLAQIERDYKTLLLPIYLPDSLSIKESRMAGRACWVNPSNSHARTVGRKVRKAVTEMNEKMK